MPMVACAFTLDGQGYASAEQYMMARSFCPIAWQPA
jgi:predicted NAD-dependent protein-ADP-ribosyltransferase YbiA (DUF1768 family)